MRKAIPIIAAFLLRCTVYSQPTPGSFEPQWSKGPQWLENAVIYQVYPSSFKDSDGNGIGDLPGALSKLDYIESLGVTAVWFNPLFESGWIDGGYDVKDYYKVDPRFGTNTDLVRFVEECHKRGIKVMLDLVPGHTSIDHPWFKQSMEADANQRYSDYYVWSDRLPDGQAEKELEIMLASEDPMHNIIGKWMVSDAPRGKYYMKNFYAGQPSLNFGFSNPDPNHPWEQGMDAPGPQALKRELKNIICFWFDKGIDGFRVDMAPSIIKNDVEWRGAIGFWREMRRWIDSEYPDHVLMAEWGQAKYCLAAGFNVDMELTGMGTLFHRMYFDSKYQSDGGCWFSLNGGKPAVNDLYGKPWPRERIDTVETPLMSLQRYYNTYRSDTDWTREWGYCATITGNHDNFRLNVGARNDPSQLKVILAWVLTQQLPILYYGDEIGLRSLAALPNVEGANTNFEERAGGRTPMQWDSSANAGFSSCEPEKLYLPVCPEWTPATSLPLYNKWKEEGCKNPTAKGYITVESQDSDPESLLNWTRSLIDLRKRTKAFWGDSEWKPVFDGKTAYPMVYLRSDGCETYLVALNPTGGKKTLNIGCQTTMKAGITLKPVLNFGKTSYRTGREGDKITMGPTSVMIVRTR